MDANEVLRNAKDIKYTISTTLDNTLVNEYGYYDHFAGDCVPFGGSSCLDIDYKSNAIVYISNSQALHQPSDEIAIDGLSLTKQISGQFDGSVQTTFGTARLINTRTDDEYSLRSWVDRPYEIKIGGTLYAGTSQEQTLKFSEYVTWFNGRIDDFSVNDRSIDLSLAALDNDFLSPFPPNIDDDGVVRPYIIGSVNGFTPKRDGGGLFRFHDGTVETEDELTDKLSDLGGPVGSNDELFDLFPSVSIGNGRDYYHDLTIGNIGGYLAIDGTGTLIDQSSLEWQQSSSVKLDEIGSGTSSVEVDDSLALSFTDKTILVSNPNTVRNTYGYGNFTWAETATGFRTTRGLSTTVTTSGDIISGGVGGGWFKFRANGSGSVNFDFAENVSSLRMVIRNVNDNFQTVSNITPSPNSIAPPFPFDGGTNHTVTFSEFNSKTLSFDYSATTVDQFVAIWFEDVQVKDAAVGVVRLNFTNDVNDIDIDVNTTNTSQSIISTTIDPSSTAGFSRSHAIAVEIGSGNIEIDLNSFRELISGEGVDYSVNDESITITPRQIPSGQDNGGIDGFRSRLPALGAGSGKRSSWNIEIRAKLNSEAISSARAVIAFDNLRFKTIDLTENWQRFSISLETPLSGLFSTRDELTFGTWRGVVSGIKSLNNQIENPDEDFSIDVDYIQAYPTDSNSQRTRVFYIDQGARVEINTYLVDDAKRYINKLPEGVALYDTKGHVCVSPNYQTIIGNFNGSSFDVTLIDAVKEISEIATGVDSVDTALTTSPLVGHAMFQQKPAIEHIQDLIGTSDYFYQDNLADSKITLKKRYDISSYPSDFSIERGDIVEGSVARNGSENKEQQYIVEYQRDWTDSSLSLTEKSRFAGNSKLDTRVIKTSLRDQADAQAVANLIERDSADNGLYRSSLINVGLGLDADQGGVQTHPDIPKSKPSIIRSITENTDTRQTLLNCKVIQN